ncbi:MAG: hypothetical protein ACQSGP_19155, partial [Frankia sp.]
PPYTGAQRNGPALWRSMSDTATPAALAVIGAVVAMATLAGTATLVRHRGRLAVYGTSADDSSPDFLEWAVSARGGSSRSIESQDDHTEKYFTVPTPPRIG